MNVLRELGESISYEETKEYLNEPENIQDTENELMARLATLNPEAQIDFLDFFFTISDENKILLLNSLKEENTGSELTQALEPIVYYDTNAKYIKNIIEILKETKCYSSKLLLDFISKSNSEYANLAKSAKNELILSGLRENPTKREILTQARNLFNTDIVQTVIDVMIDDGFNSFCNEKEEFKIEYILDADDLDNLGEEYQEQISKDIMGIKEALLSGTSSYELKYNVEVEKKIQRTAKSLTKKRNKN